MPQKTLQCFHVLIDVTSNFSGVGGGQISLNSLLQGNKLLWIKQIRMEIWMRFTKDEPLNTGCFFQCKWSNKRAGGVVRGWDQENVHCANKICLFKAASAVAEATACHAWLSEVDFNLFHHGIYMKKRGGEWVFVAWSEFSRVSSICANGVNDLIPFPPTPLLGQCHNLFKCSRQVQHALAQPHVLGSTAICLFLLL